MLRKAGRAGCRNFLHPALHKDPRERSAAAAAAAAVAAAIAAVIVGVGAATAAKQDDDEDDYPRTAAEEIITHIE